MEVVIHHRFSAYYYEKLEENKWFAMTTFKVIPNSDQVRSTASAFGIYLMDETVVTSTDARPTDQFNNLIRFDYILEGTFDTELLVGKCRPEHDIDYLILTIILIIVLNFYQQI